MYMRLGSDGKGRRLWILPSGGSAADRKPLSFLRTEFDEETAGSRPTAAGWRTSPNQSGKNEIYVLPFDASNPGSPAAGGLRQVSKDGGTASTGARTARNCSTWRRMDT